MKEMKKVEIDILSYFPKEHTPSEIQADLLRAYAKIPDNVAVVCLNAPVACHAKGQGVLMFDGSIKPIETVDVGDQLMGPDSTPRTVLHTVRGNGPMYRLTPKKGAEPWIVSENHILAVKTWVKCWDKFKGAYGRTFRAHEITVKDLLERGESFKKNTYQYMASVDFYQKELPLDPYLLGLWLGDGTSVQPSICTMEPEVEEYWSSWGVSHGLSVTKKAKPDNKAFQVSLVGVKGKRNILTSTLKDVGVFDNKHIPQIYLTSSREQRLQLIAGLLDTDGFVHEESFEISSKWEHLAKQMVFLFRSVGMSAAMHLKVVKGVTYYRVTGSSGEGVLPPCKVPRRQMRLAKSNQRNSGFTISPAGDQDFFGVTVDGDSLYLLDSFVVTHNCGKSLLLTTIGAYEHARHQGGATLVAPTNQLVAQLFDTGKSSGYVMAPYKFAERKISWEVAKKQFLATPHKIANYMGYLANRAYSRCLLIDEAHTIRGLLQDMEGLKLWYHLTPWPLSIRTIDQFLYWLASESDDEPSLKKARKLLSKDPTSYILEQETAPYKGTDQLCLKVVPLTPKNNRPVFWPPSKVKRIVLASATLSREDLADIGLDKRYTAWLSAPSRIPPDRRPWIYAPCAHPTYGRPDEIRKLSEGILDTAAWHEGERGLVHVTYAMSSQLRPHLSGNGRMIFHTKESKGAAFKRWQATPDGILVAAGMHEGVDLKYDMARWQIIAKAVWPSLANAAVKVKAEQRPDWYIWETLKIMMQAYGRVCRMPDDYGVTYILTAEFSRLYKEALSKGLVPEWFKEASLEEWENK